MPLKINYKVCNYKNVYIKPKKKHWNNKKIIKCIENCMIPRMW